MVFRSLQRLKYRILTFRDYGKVLNRCATVEQLLLDVANGKKPEPNRDTCRAWAQKLGGNNDFR